MVDFRSDRMESPEGRGKARRAWDVYVGAVGKVSTPALRPFVEMYAAGSIVDLIGFWMVWHLEGGFEGLRAMGMSRASIYRRMKLFRIAFGAHPDEFEMPGVHARPGGASGGLGADQGEGSGEAGGSRRV